MTNVEKHTEDNSQGGHDTLDNADYQDLTMSVEKLDDTVAVLTFTATVITIALGFIFNL